MDARDPRWGRLAASAALSVLLSVWANATGAAERVALVVGNSAYEHTDPLANPGNDADGMAAALGRLGFEVVLGKDLDLGGFYDKIREFDAASRGADVTLFFYAGHGLQVQGKNWLAPVDAKLGSRLDLKSGAVELDTVLEHMRGTKKLVYLDACRNNPLAGDLARSMGLSRTAATSRGLARVRSGRGTLIGYATEPGDVAADGDGRNSPFTEALLAHIETPGLSVNDMFGEVSGAVSRATGGEQVPWSHSSLGRFYLASAALPPPPPPPGGAKAAYEEAKEVGNVAAMLAVVKRFPGTFEADLAQAWIDKHEQPIVVAGGDPDDIEPAPSPEAVEQGLGQSREERRQVQMGLAAAGQDPGPLDGHFGGKTRRALRAWQASKEVEATGYLTKEQGEVLAALGREEAQRRRAEAERERKAKEAEAAALRARKEAERKAREAEERRLAEAERRADDEAFARARRLHTESGYRDYLARGGRRRHEAEARALLSQVTEPAWDVGDTFRDCPGCPEMVVVPSGRFRMGSPESEAGRYDDEGPVRQVTIARPFAVGVNEVTRGEFARFVSATGRSMGNACWTYEGGEWKERSGRHWRSPGFSQTDSHPVVCVNWSDAKAYVRWLSGETGEAYRLLSEAEWEYVARAGTRTARYWGEDERGQCRYANGVDETFGWSGAFCEDGHARTAPVGSYEANPFGLYDVHGNVGEWVEDCWNDSYYGAPSNGSAWESGECGRRVLRGGSWSYGPWDLRAANRLRNTSGVRDYDLGFRVARTLTP